MQLTQQLIDYVSAGFSGLWIVTHEADEATRDIVRLAKAEKWTVASWDAANGLRLFGKAKRPQPEIGGNEPLAALRALSALGDVPVENDEESDDADADNGKDRAKKDKEDDTTALLLLPNFHRFLNNTEVIQTLFSQLIAGKAQGTFVVVLSPVVQIPIELEKLFVVIDHQLPNRDQLQQIARTSLSNSLHCPTCKPSLRPRSWSADMLPS
jgi:hypothetical protein